jgi:uncharacterized membrane protein YidH (DUF202 family)
MLDTRPHDVPVDSCAIGDRRCVPAKGGSASTPRDTAMTPRDPERDDGERASPGTAEPHFSDASRRTYLSQERTLLAWWRTALGTISVAVAVGSLLPELAGLPEGPLLALGAGYAALNLCFALLGGYRQLAGEEALSRRRYLGLSPGTVIALTVYLTALLAATAWVMLLGLD